MTDIAPCPRCHYGAGPQGAERYWEARWRDEKARNDALVKHLRRLAIRACDEPALAVLDAVSSVTERNDG